MESHNASVGKKFTGYLDHGQLADGGGRFWRGELDPGGEGEVPEAIPDCFLVQIEFFGWDRS